MMDNNKSTLDLMREELARRSRHSSRIEEHWDCDGDNDDEDWDDEIYED